MSTSSHVFVAVDDDEFYLGEQPLDREAVQQYLNDNHELASAWEAAAFSVVEERIDDRDSLRLHLPKEIPYDTKKKIEALLADEIGFESGASALIEQPPRSSMCDVYTFGRNQDAVWQPADVPVYRSVTADRGQDGDLARRVADRYITHCFPQGDCSRYDGFYPSFGDYDTDHYLLKGDEWNTESPSQGKGVYYE
jgi:hypothetical protein